MSAQAVRAQKSVASALAALRGPRDWSYPLMGNMLQTKKAMEEGRTLMDLMYDWHQEHGSIYKGNLAGPGKDDQVFLTDPNEFLKVFQAEGKHPYGMAIEFWPMVYYFKKAGMRHAYHLLEEGEPWKELRHKIQTHIFGLKTSRAYLPSINDAVAQGVAVADQWQDNFEMYIKRLSFDMFCAAVIGESLNTADKGAVTPAHEKLVDDVCEMFTLGVRFAFHEPKEAVVINALPRLRGWPGLTTPTADRFVEYADAGFGGCAEIVREVVGRCERGEAVNDCFVKRMVADENVSREEIEEVVAVLLSAGIDTTASLTQWILVNLAENPDKQELLYQELDEKLAGGMITDKTKLPYLKAVVRESWRKNPVHPFASTRRIAADLELSGEQIPMGTVVKMDACSRTRDVFAETHEQFIPERWLDDAVEARKGTPEEVVDNKLISGPFGFGARMCLGARVAQLEVNSFVAKLIQEWKIELDPPGQEYSPKIKLMYCPHPFPKLKLTRRNGKP